MYLKPEIGKLYKMIHYETADEFHRYVGPDDFGQEIFAPITTGERALLSGEILMLVKEKSFTHDGQELVQWVFLANESIYHTTPYEQAAFGNIFVKVTKNRNDIPTWKSKQS